MRPHSDGSPGPFDASIVRVSVAAIVLGVAGLVTISALFALSLCGDTDASGESADPVAEAVGSEFAMNPGDHKAMHDANLPTRSDVLGWHMCGRWGFPRDGEDGYEVHVFHDLPGGAWVWDALYGLDPNDERFKFKEGSPYED